MTPSTMWRVGPIVCWLAGTGVVIFWHVPRMFEVGMRLHGLEQTTVFLGGLLLWFPVVRPWPVQLVHG